ncbi:UNVERIFIED_CONTAM: COP9 signalosome complex subunit [Sesamum radiatum]|uniref:COP9 signalosome complex subunit n=1 Tax=Sesamum radiatum TaxID=300843 RepID=A0AAW2P881_SESRA
MHEAMNLNVTSAESLVAQIQGLSSNVDDVTQQCSCLKQSENWLRVERLSLAPLQRIQYRYAFPWMPLNSRLIQRYLTLSLQDIANTVKLNSPKEAEMHVLQMVGEAWHNCIVSQHLECVLFDCFRMMMLSKKLRAMSEVKLCDPSYYLGKVGKERQRYEYDDFDTVPSKLSN